MQQIGLMELMAFFGTVLLLIAPVVVIGIVFSLALRRQTDAMQKAIRDGFAQQHETLRKELEALREKIPAAAPTQAVAAPAPVKAPQSKISEDKLMILGAVLACHFGKRVKIRSARVITVGSGSNVWSQQGRAAVQASHSVLH
jgi:hypothetical protein